MFDTIGRIAVPTVINSRRTFPLATQYPFGFSVERPVIVHRFGSLDAKQELRYYVGIGPRKFQFKRPSLGWTYSSNGRVCGKACSHLAACVADLRTEADLSGAIPPNPIPGN